MGRGLFYTCGIIFAALAVLLTSGEAYANRVAASSGFSNLITTLCWCYGLVYIGIAATKFFKAWRSRSINPGSVPPKSGAVFFLPSGACLLAVPFIISSMQGSILEENGIYKPGFFERLFQNEIAAFVMAGLFVVAPFFPWVMLVALKSLRHLRKQGIIGLCLTPVVPVVFLAIGYIYALMRS